MNISLSTHPKQAELITQIVKYGDRLIVIQGDTIPQRRAFIKLINHYMPKDVLVTTLQVRKDLTLKQVRQAQIEALQLSPGIESAEQFAKALITALAVGQRAVLVLEDVHLWSDETLDQLLEDWIVIEQIAPRNLRLILSGDTSLLPRVQAHHGLIKAKLQIHPVELADRATAASAAGSAVHTVGDEPTTARADQLTLASLLNSPRQLSRRTLIIAAVVVSAVTAIGFVLLSFDRTENNTGPATNSTQIALDVRESTETLAPSTPPSQPPKAVAIESPPAATLPPPPESTLAEKSTHIDKSAIATTKLEPVVETVPEPETMPEAESTAEAVATPVAERVPTAEPPAATTPARTEPASDSEHSLIADANWFQSTPRTRHVLQLAAFGDEKAVERFLQQHGLSRSDVRIFRQKPGDTMLYTITWGDFASSEFARREVQNLPPSLQEGKPYPRAIGDIRDVMIK